MQDKMIIRNVFPEDARQLLDIYAYYVEKTAITFEYGVPSVEEFRERICRTLTRYPYLAAEENGRLLGYAYAGPFVGREAYDWSCELTIYLEHTWVKKGIGKALYAALENELKRMGILNLYACIGLPETEDEYLTRNSADFHAHMGFVEAGRFRKCGYKFGRWYDMIWMEKMLGEHTDGEAPVRKSNRNL